MNLRDGILDTFADDMESLIQVESYLKFLNICATRQEIIEELLLLLEQKLIVIVDPILSNDVKDIDIENITDFWFQLTDIGREEWDKIQYI